MFSLAHIIACSHYLFVSVNSFGKFNIHFSFSFSNKFCFIFFSCFLLVVLSIFYWSFYLFVIGRLVRMSVSGYRGRLFEPRHKYLVSLNKTLYPHLSLLQSTQL